MDEQPHQSLKKENSSISVAARLVHEKQADAVVSPGNTGATMAACMVTWKRLPGISRPAIATLLPHPKRPCLLLDVGANVDCKGRNLLHFAIMGSTYARYVLHRRNPQVGILSNGEEDCKGTEMVKEAGAFLRASTLNFAGNAEGRDLMRGAFDVVVCDGFVGNVVLKFGEGLAEFIMTNLKDEVRRSVIAKVGALTMLPALQRFRKQVDHAEYGGAPLLGLNGVCIICHGSSRAKAIRNAIRVASEQVSLRVNHHILETLQANPDIHAKPPAMAAH
jgi:glycerol-3-phosphate acyltransferase PlsX